MILHFKINDQVTIDVEADTQSEAFMELAAMNESFNIHQCGLCRSDSGIYPRTRRNKNDDVFLEYVCNNGACKAILAMGQNKKGGGIYPTRKDKSGAYIPNGGWTRWVPEKKD